MSDDPRDLRTRPSIVVNWDDASILIDTTPELRLQCLANDIRRVDAVLYTHYHIDHVAGLDDLRRFNWLQEAPVPVYAQTDTLDRLQSMFPYVFDQETKQPSAIPKLDLHAIDGPFEVAGRSITPIPLLHGTMSPINSIKAPPPLTLRVIPTNGLLSISKLTGIRVGMRGVARRSALRPSMLDKASGRSMMIVDIALLARKSVSSNQVYVGYRYALGRNELIRHSTRRVGLLGVCARARREVLHEQ